MSTRSVVLFAFALSLLALPAAAQGPSVSVSLTGDIVRFSHTSVDGRSDGSDGGEAIGFALRLGIPVGSRWGVEAELARSSEISSPSDPRILSAVDVAFPVVSSPIFSIDVTNEQRYTSLATTAWARQDLTSRVGMVYTGGISFMRTESTFGINYAFVRAIPGLILPPTQRLTSIIYSVRPVVGAEARIALTEHVELIPGVRLTGLENGWLIRPAVGLGWSF